MPDEEDITTPPEVEASEPPVEEEVPEPPPHGRIPPEGPPAEPPAEAPSADADRPVTLADLTVYDTLRFMVGLLAQQAWLRLGLQVAPGRTEPALDLVQARVAIDTLESVIRQLAADGDEGEKREFNILLADLRVNYLKKAG